MFCSICGKEFNKPCFNKPYDDVCWNCFGEKLWRIREQEYLNGEAFIISNGWLYTDEGYKTNTNPSYLGYGGQIFNIRMNDGTEICTNNLWCGGKIPENHREILSDNAVFYNKIQK